MTTLPIFPDPVNADLAAALDRMYLAALARYPDEERRLTLGHGIALVGGVELVADGIAMVRSAAFSDTRFAVNGHCLCNAAQEAPGGRCKHRYAKVLWVRALTYLAQQTDAPLEELPGPYAFPEYRRYLATYAAPGTELCGRNGIATLIEPGRFLFVAEGDAHGVECSYNDVALGPGLEEEGVGRIAA